MINIAEGKKLSFSKNQIKTNGWAIEARLCSEDPIKNFLPSAGKIKKMNFSKKLELIVDMKKVIQCLFIMTHC